MNEEIKAVSDGIIIYALCAVIVSESLYIAKMYRDNWKRAQEDKKAEAEKVERDKIRDDLLLREMIVSITRSNTVVENCIDVIEKNNRHLYLINYAKKNENLDSGG